MEHRLQALQRGNRIGGRFYEIPRHREESEESELSVSPLVPSVADDDADSPLVPSVADDADSSLVPSVADDADSSLVPSVADDADSSLVPSVADD
eukprot:gene6919-32641_t